MDIIILVNTCPHVNVQLGRVDNNIDFHPGTQKVTLTLYSKSFSQGC